MSSPQDWVWEAFSLYDTLYKFMPPFILRMNTKRRMLLVEPSKFKRMFWCFSIFINAVVLLLGSCLYAVRKWYLAPKSLQSAVVAAAGALILIGILATYTCMIHFIYREEHVLGVNTLLHLHASKMKAAAKLHKRKGGKKKPTKELKQILLGYTMKGLVLGFFLMIPVLLPVALFEGVDPWRVVLLDLVPQEWLDKYPVHVSLTVFLIRTLLFITVGLEIIRFYSMFFLLFISGIIIYVDYIERFIVKTAISERVTTSSFKDFHLVRLIVQILTPVLRREICCLMFTGFLIAVFANVGMVQCYDIFPWYVYGMSVFVFIITITIIYCTLPFGTDVNEKTTFALVEWKTRLSNLPPIESKMARKILQSMRPVSVRCGPFFILQRETKSSYFDYIVTTSADLNISWDLKAIFAKGF